jgi:hypothetical protein
MGRVLEQFAHNISAYNTPNNMPVSDALRRFLDYDRTVIINKADPDLRRWLPPALWDRMKGEGVASMVDYARSVIEVVAFALDNPKAKLPELPRTLAASLLASRQYSSEDQPAVTISPPAP